MEQRASRLTGRDLRAERVRTGLTQAQLGILIGVSARRIANVEGQYRVAPAFAARVVGALAALPADVA